MSASSQKPINRYAYNFIDFLIPDNESLSEAEQSYFYLYKLALEDGVISQDEQKMLDFTARNLGLDSEDVLRIKNRITSLERFSISLNQYRNPSYKHNKHHK